ncbi:MAG: helix-turn-helix domain-containing protein [Treponema sp.]|nr:helix-turn-helix domain-containing protein [Treponema sp.]
MIYTELDLLDVFSKNLKIQRLKKHYSQEKLADLTNTTVVTISNYERGESWPSSRSLAAIIDVLKISPYELFIDTDQEIAKIKMEFKEQFLKIVDSMDEHVEYGSKRNLRKRAKKIQKK